MEHWTTGLKYDIFGVHIIFGTSMRVYRCQHVVSAIGISVAAMRDDHK